MLYNQASRPGLACWASKQQGVGSLLRPPPAPRGHEADRRNNRRLSDGGYRPVEDPFLTRYDVIAVSGCSYGGVKGEVYVWDDLIHNCCKIKTNKSCKPFCCLFRTCSQQPRTALCFGGKSARRLRRPGTNNQTSA